jgi:hypothetical protein
MAVMPKKFSLFIFIPFYFLFAWMFVSIIDSYVVVEIYLITILNRMRFAFMNVSEQLKNKTIKKSILAIMIYFFLAMAVSIGNKMIPDFGLSEQNLIEIGYMKAKKHGGLFLDIPKTAICLGGLYYTFMAFVTYTISK